MQMTRNTLLILVTIGLLLAGTQVAMAALPPVGSPPAPASNLSPPMPLIGMAITFLCFILVVAVNLIPSKRKDVK
ncbi:MAG: hypothetical protein VX527_02115 [Planctomycetota bacterium]|nr:hypothetical protein [Planctomycetota bacterium]